MSKGMCLRSTVYAWLNDSYPIHKSQAMTTINWQQILFRNLNSKKAILADSDILALRIISTHSFC